MLDQNISFMEVIASVICLELSVDFSVSERGIIV